MLQGKAVVAAAVVCLLVLVCAANAEEITVSGRVVGPDNQPVPDCRVFAVHEIFRPNRVADETTSDVAGRFSFTLEVPHGRPSVRVLAVKQGLALDWDSAKRGKDVTLKLGAGPATCTGIVVDPDGNPIVGAQVSVNAVRRPHEGTGRQRVSLPRHSFLRDSTNEEGRFEIAGLPAKAKVGLVIAAEGWGQLETQAELAVTSQRLRFILNPEATISGRIVHDGQPVAGATVFSYEVGLGSEIVAETTSAEDGTYTLSQLPFGLYLVGVPPPRASRARWLGQ